METNIQNEVASNNTDNDAMTETQPGGDMPAEKKDQVAAPDINDPSHPDHPEHHRHLSALLAASHAHSAVDHVMPHHRELDN